MTSVLAQSQSTFSGSGEQLAINFVPLVDIAAITAFPTGKTLKSFQLEEQLLSETEVLREENQPGLHKLCGGSVVFPY